MAYNELEIFSELDHPNVVRFYRSFQDEKAFHIVMEYCSGGDLKTMMSKKQNLTEKEVASIMGQAFSAVKYLHDKGIIHRDIKVENFLFKDESPDSEIKLIDFGLACFSDPNKPQTICVGTPLCVAPEVLKKYYDYRCDIWSLGVMMYTLIYGHPPFNAETMPQLIRKILILRPEFPSEFEVSEEARNLMKRLLDKDPETRISLEDALNDPWIKKGRKSNDVTREECQTIIENFQHFTYKTRIARFISSRLVHLSNSQELEFLNRAFRRFDKHNAGTISVSSLQDIVQEYSLSYTGSELSNMTASMNLEKIDRISYSEFLAAAATTKSYLELENLSKTFSFLDVQGSGSLTVNDIQLVLLQVGNDFKKSDAQELFRHYEIPKRGKLTLDDFLLVMRDNQQIEMTKSLPSARSKKFTRGKSY